MSNGEIDTTALIISICVIVPALIAIAVCTILYWAHRQKDRKLHRQTIESTSYEYEHSRERRPRDAYIIDFTRGQHQRRRELQPPIFEHSPPAYDTTIVQTRTHPIRLHSPVRTTPSSTNIHRPSPNLSPSIYSAMPPSYAEIFLTPQTISNG